MANDKRTLSERPKKLNRPGVARRAPQSQAREDAILNSAPDAIITMDHEGKFVEFNPAAERIFGYSRTKVLGKPLADLIIPARLREKHKQGLAYYVATGTGPVLNRHIELPALRADGTEFPAELAIVPVADSDPPLFTGFLRDITGRKQAEEAVRESEERYRTLFASAPMAVFVCDRNAVIQYYNRRAAEVWGREPVCGTEQHCGSAKLWYPDGTPLPHAQSPIMEVLRTGTPALNVEVFIERPDGSRVPVLVNFSALRNAHGEITGAITSFVDITERKLAEEALRESEDRFRAIAENIPQLAWMADREGNVDWFNRGWLEYTGTTLEDNLSAGWKAVHHPDYVDAVAEKFERHLREGRDWEDTFPLRGKDGNYRWFLSRMNVIRDEAGRFIRFFGTNTDITNEREAVERQRLLMGELAHRGGNLLAVIQSIVSRSLTGTRPLTEERETLARRIQALARSQSALMNGGFGARVADIIRLEFEAFSNRVIAVGPDVMLNSRTAQTFALLVHELATNATKYGALSLPEKGQIDIHWSIEGAGKEARFMFQWQERDGPPVVPPTRQGFGSMLFEKVAAQDFGVPPKIRFAPDGLSYEIDAPLSVVTAGSVNRPDHNQS